MHGQQNYTATSNVMLLFWVYFGNIKIYMYIYIYVFIQQLRDQSVTTLRKTNYWILILNLNFSSMLDNTVNKITQQLATIEIKEKTSRYKIQLINRNFSRFFLNSCNKLYTMTLIHYNYCKIHFLYKTVLLNFNNAKNYHVGRGNEEKLAAKTQIYYQIYNHWENGVKNNHTYQKLRTFFLRCVFIAITID